MMTDLISTIPLHWVIFSSIICGLLIFDLGVFSKSESALTIKQSLLLTLFYITIGVSFGFVILNIYNPTEFTSCSPKCHVQAAGYYWNAFIIEKVLSIDNIFVMSLIFGSLQVPSKYQHRVLFWGILGVIIMRGLMIGLGTALVHEFSWLLYVFGAFLVFTGFKMLFNRKDEEDDDDIQNNKIIRYVKKFLPITNQFHGSKFFVKLHDDKTGRLKLFFTPLMTALIFVEIADIIFAVDSVPAIFSITLDPFIVYTSNIFAILGLRALYSALDAVLDKFKYLEPALAIVLIFIGSKIFIADLLGIEKLPIEFSLGVTIGVISIGMVYSIWKNSQEKS